MQRRNTALFYAAVTVLCLILAGAASGGPPFLTDDPDTPGPNHWEINIAITSQDVAQQWQLGTPLFDINYGVGDHIQLKYQFPVEVDVPKDGAVRGGLGNPLAGVKWRFIDQTNGCWVEVSTYPQFEFACSGSAVRRGLADDGSNLILPLEIERQMKGLTIYGELGYIINENRGGDFFYGLAAERELTEKFSLMAELYGGVGSGFQENGLSFNLGFHLAMTEHVALIGSAGRAIFGPAGAAPTFMSYLGTQLTF